MPRNVQVVSLVLLVAIAIAGAQGEPLSFCPPYYPAGLFKANINKVRASKGLAPLIWSVQLEAKAQKLADHVAAECKAGSLSKELKQHVFVYRTPNSQDQVEDAVLCAAITQSWLSQYPQALSEYDDRELGCAMATARDGSCSAIVCKYTKGQDVKPYTVHHTNRRMLTTAEETSTDIDKETSETSFEESSVNEYSFSETSVETSAETEEVGEAELTYPEESSSYEESSQEVSETSLELNYDIEEGSEWVELPEESSLEESSGSEVSYDVIESMDGGKHRSRHSVKRQSRKLLGNL